MGWKQKIFQMLKLYLWQWWRIPRGDYCYKIKGIKRNKGKKKPPIIYVKICPYWDTKIKDGYCYLLNRSSPLLWDEVKECNFKQKG